MDDADDPRRDRQEAGTEPASTPSAAPRRVGMVARLTTRLSNLIHLPERIDAVERRQAAEGLGQRIDAVQSSVQNVATAIGQLQKDVGQSAIDSAEKYDRQIETVNQSMSGLRHAVEVSTGALDTLGKLMARMDQDQVTANEDLVRANENLVKVAEDLRGDILITRGLIESLQIVIAEGTTSGLDIEALPAADTRLAVDFPASIEKAYPSEFPAAWRVMEETAELVRRVDFSAMSQNWPASEEFDWDNYLRCSLIRLVRASSAVREAKVETGRVLDLGSFFGNFSLMFAASGYQVQAADTYGEFGPALAPLIDRMKNEKVEILDLSEVGFDLSGLPAESVDVVLSMSVIEHIAHTPRPMLEAIHRVLRPGGILILETPNQAYLYNRLKLASGMSVYAPISSQYVSEIPFKGHHREYTADEVQWMVEQAGFGVERVELFNYSIYQLPELEGRDIVLHRLMDADPLKRELIMMTARKPTA